MSGIRKQKISMKEIKVFIAGSTSLKNEFNAITDALRIITNSNSKGIRITPKTYEDYKDPFSLEGDQAKYNRFIMHKADYVIFVLDGEIGGVTLQEFDVAWNTFASKKRPGIYVYHKPSNTISKGIQDVIGRINQCKQYYTEYTDLENLKLKVESAFRRVIDIHVISPITKLWVTLVATILVLIGVGMFVLKNKLASRPDVTITTMDTHRQDSIEKALQVEANRLAQEREQLEKRTRQAEAKSKQTVTKSSSKSVATSSTPTATTVVSPATPTTTVVSPATPPQTNSFLQTKEKADNGDAASCYKVALAYMNGNDVVNKNPANAFHYMKSAADRGYTAAYIEVAKMYHGGRGVAKNRSTAEFWYKKAADAGNAEARRILLNM